MDNTLKEVLLDGAARQIRIRFPESDREEITSGIATGSAKLQCKLNSKEELNFGECNAAQFSVEIDDIDDITGEVIQVYALVEGYTPEVPIFYGRVYSAKRRPEIGSREIVAYDFLYDRAQEDVTSWYRALFASVDSMTLLAFRTALFTHMGIQQETVTLMNDAVSVQKMILKDDAVLTFGDCVTAICQMNACFGHVSPSGGFEYVSLGENIYDYSANYQALKSSYEEYAVAPIDRIRLYDGMGNISVAAGSGTNTWNLANNFLLYGLAEETLIGIANRLMAHVGVITYVPVRLDALISLPIEPGSKINVTTHTGDTFSTYALDLTYSGSQLVDQEIAATGKELRDSSLSTDDTLILLDLRLQDTQSSVEEAHDEAAAAQTTANNAMTAANGKTRIFYQNDAPAVGMAVGDMWFDTDGGNAIYQYTANGWVLRQLGSGSLAANSVTAVEINVATLSAITANIGTVTAGVLRSSDYQAQTGSSVYSTAGMIIDLDNKVIRTPKTAILSDGSIYSSSVDLEGKITATSGKIGGWYIDDYLWYQREESGVIDTTWLDGDRIYGKRQTSGIAASVGYELNTKGKLELYGRDTGTPSLTITKTMGNIRKYGILYENSILFQQNNPSYNISLDAGTDGTNGTLTLGGTPGSAYFIAPNIKATGAFYGSLTGHASLDLPLTGGTLSGSVAISATGRGYNLTDASGTTYGGIYENGDNLWIGAASSTSPHHRGANGNTYISSGYSTSNSAGNSTVYVWVPTLSGTTWGGNAYGVLHTGNYSSYALPLSGGTLSGNLTFSATTDNGIIQGYNGTTKYNIIRNHGNGNVSLSACSAGLHLGYTNTTFINFMNGLMSLNSSGQLSLTGSLILPNNIWIYAKDVEGTARILTGIGKDTSGTTSNYFFGYGSKAASSGVSFFDGNTVYIRSNNSIYMQCAGASINAALTVTGTITGYDYSGASHVMVGSAADASHRVGYLYHQNPTTVRVYGQAGGSGYTTYTTLTGSSSSDIRLKKNVADTEIADALSVINQIEMRSFDWIPGHRDYTHQPIGMIADQIEKLDSRLVIGGGYDPDGQPNYKVIDDHYLSCYLTKGVQELCDEIEKLKERIRRLEAA